MQAFWPNTTVHQCSLFLYKDWVTQIWYVLKCGTTCHLVANYLWIAASERIIAMLACHFLQKEKRELAKLFVVLITNNKMPLQGKLISAGVGKSGNVINKVMYGVWSVLIVTNRLKLFNFCLLRLYGLMFLYTWLMVNSLANT